MTNDPQIDEFSAEVNRLAIALERGECEGDPDLQPPLMLVQLDHHGTGRSYIPPLVSDYWQARRMLAKHKQPITDLQTARQHLANVRAELAHKEQRRLDGYSGASNLRRMIDLDVLCEYALRDLRAIEAQLEQSARSARRQRREQSERSAGVVRRDPRRKLRIRSV